MKKILTTLFIGLGLVLSLGLTSPSVSAATAKQEVCDGIGATVGENGCTDGSGKSLNEIMALVINIFSWVVGAVAVIFAIVAGFKYITSGGDASAVKSAKDTLFYVIIGLVIVALSQIIVKFVLNKSSKLSFEPKNNYSQVVNSYKKV